jgi:hypothetical protein
VKRVRYEVPHYVVYSSISPHPPSRNTEVKYDFLWIQKGRQKSAIGGYLYTASHTIFCLENVKGIHNLENLAVDGKIILDDS